MAVKTSNYYGKITITDDAIAMTAHFAAMDCYGVADLISRKLTDSLVELFNSVPIGKGVRVTSVKNRINLELFVELKDGVNIETICDSITNTVKYNVETFTGMRVNEVTVNVVGVRL